MNKHELIGAVAAGASLSETATDEVSRPYRM